MTDTENPFKPEPADRPAEKKQHQPKAHPQVVVRRSRWASGEPAPGSFDPSVIKVRPGFTNR